MWKFQSFQLLQRTFELGYIFFPRLTPILFLKPSQNQCSCSYKIVLIKIRVFFRLIWFTFNYFLTYQSTYEDLQENIKMISNAMQLSFDVLFILSYTFFSSCSSYYSCSSIFVCHDAQKAVGKGRFQNLFKYLRWSFLKNKLTTESSQLFLQKAPTYIYNWFLIRL